MLAPATVFDPPCGSSVSEGLEKPRDIFKGLGALGCKIEADIITYSGPQTQNELRILYATLPESLKNPPTSSNVGALNIRRGFGGILCYKYSYD